MYKNNDRIKTSLQVQVVNGKRRLAGSYMMPKSYRIKLKLLNGFKKLLGV